MHKKKTLLASLLLSGSLLIQGVIVAAQEYHLVSSGETLYSIARSYGVTVDQIQAWNGLSGTLIDVGDQLIVSSQMAEDYPNQPAETIPDAQQTSGVYTVQAGNTLSGIARAFGITVDQLYAWNGLTSSFLDVGDQLAVSPSGGPIHNPPASTYIQNYGDWTPSSPSYDTAYYTVTAGDTLWDIAWYYGTTVDTLMAMNGLWSDYLDVGDVLLVPITGQSYIPYDPAPSYDPPAPEVPSGEEPSSRPEADTRSGQDSSQETQESSESSRSTGQITFRDADGNRRLVAMEDLPEAARPKTHRVRSGENIWTIAEDYEVSAASLRVWNRLRTDSLTVGQRLYVSNPAFVPEIHSVKAEEDLASIAVEYETTVDNLRDWNKLEEGAEVQVGDILIVSDPNPDTHTVEPGESLEAVADQYNITVEALREWNHLPEETDLVNGTLIVSDPRGDRPAGSDTSGQE